MTSRTLVEMLFFLLTFVVFSATLSTSQGAPPHAIVRAIRATERSSILPSCTLCNLVVRGIYQSFSLGLSNEEIIDNIALTCVGLKLYPEEVCRGVASIAAPTVRYIFNSSKVDPGNICGILMQEESCSFTSQDKLEWTIPPSTLAKPALMNELGSPPPADGPVIKVLHFADPHWDPEYLEGSNANCGSPLCCRAASGTVTKVEDAAGYWGDYRKCDMPWRTLENTVEHMAKHHPDTAYIVWTGDLVPHDNWSTNREENMLIHDRVLSLMRRHFPDTPIYPTLGNHEAHPVNSFAPPEIVDEELNTNWLYNDSDRLWAKIGLPSEVSSTIRLGGYYTTLARPGLRIVSLNTNYCYTFNWWTLYSGKDPASGLQWLSETLEKAEQAGEKVHIIAHIPPGNEDCWSVYSREFEKIISRFEATVSAQFYGHTHNEEFKVFYDEFNRTRPVNVAFIAGSVTTFTDLNPSYRVYTVDGPRQNSTWNVLDFTTVMMNLTKANEVGPTQPPEWFDLYSAKSEYSMTDLSPKSIDNLFTRMLKDSELFNLYFKNSFKAVDQTIQKGCDDKCRYKLLCRIVTTNIADKDRCKQIAPTKEIKEKR